MVHPSINKSTPSKDAVSIKHEIHVLKKKIKHLEQQLYTIQQHCQHEFTKTAMMKKCKKCQLTESLYY